jgi:hypothetical protein
MAERIDMFLSSCFQNFTFPQHAELFNHLQTRNSGCTNRDKGQLKGGGLGVSNIKRNGISKKFTKEEEGLCINQRDGRRN